MNYFTPRRGAISLLVAFLVCAGAPIYSQSFGSPDGLLGPNSVTGGTSGASGSESPESEGSGSESPGSEGSGSGEAAAIDSQRVKIAIAQGDYPVTPGDVFSLSYQTGRQSASIRTVVLEDYTVDLGIVGVTNAQGLAFPELRREVGRLVQNAYPDSEYQLTLQSTGVFEVHAYGAISTSRRFSAWANTRLADLYESLSASYTSVRRVRLHRRDGSVRNYDLFQALRFGDVGENPRLRPGDRVEFTTVGPMVSVRGEVLRPGQYELARGESLATVIQDFAGGFTALADRERVRVTRNAVADAEDSPRVLDADLTARDGRDFELRDQDQISVPSITDFLPVVYLEGALTIPGEAGGEPRQPIRRSLREGESLYDILDQYRSRLSESGDLRNGFIRREGRAEPIRVDMERLLFGSQLELDVALEPNDRIIIPTGTFQVYVTGEVTRSAFVDVRSLTRLSEVVERFRTDFASVREVTVRSASGDEQSFDLFRALRFGEREDDPYLQPGDTVLLNRRDREVQIQGQVERPGTYQLLEGEQLGELVDKYGGGYTKQALVSRVSLTREFPGAGEFGDRRYLDLTEPGWRGFELRDQDRIRIGNEQDQLPTVFFEGAVQGATTDEDVAQAGTAGRVSYRFYPGETIDEATQDIRGIFLDTAVLQEATLIRAANGESVPVDLAEFLYSESATSGIALERNDRIIVPFRQFFVSVSGAVQNSGRYPYIPGRGYEYYLGLAGGTDSNRHWFENPVITSVDGERRRDRAEIQPEDTINFRTNNPIFYINPVIGVTSSVLSAIAIILQVTN